MTLADKIINLRKQNGWSQEELAEKLDVTRQSVSKWESAQSVPDISKILQLSELFGVTTDYLLKDNDGEPVFEEKRAEAKEERDDGSRKVGEKEAREYLDAAREAAKKIALAVFMCILSPVCLLLLIGANEDGYITAIPEDTCALIGIIVLLLIVAAAVMLFIFFGMPLTKYDYMEKEPIKLDEAARRAMEREKEATSASYIMCNAIGVALCFMGAISAILGAFAENEMLVMVGVCGTLLLCGIGVYLFVLAGVPWGAMQKMLEEGDYTRANKVGEKIMEPISGLYWVIVTAIYLIYSFVTFEWHISWVIWPLAGVLFWMISAIFGIFSRKDK